jgi:hypothetical protein
MQRHAIRPEPTSAAARPAPNAGPAPLVPDPGLRQPSAPPAADGLAPLLRRAVEQRGATAGGGALLARKHGGTSIGTLRAATIKQLETAVDAGDYAAATTAVTALAAADRAALVRLLVYKLGKHELAKASIYLGCTYYDPRLKFELLERSLASGNARATRWLAPLLGDLLKPTSRDYNPADAARIVAVGAAHFLAAGVPALLKENTADVIVLVLKDRGVMDVLRAQPGYAALVEQLPILKANRDAVRDAGDGASAEAIIDAMFAIFISGEMNLGYIGTSGTQPQDMLLGRDTRVGRQRGPKPRVLLDCHRLAAAFADMVRANHELAVDIGVDQDHIYEAVLTEPLQTLPGGLIAKTYKGNVFDDFYVPTNQIFFSADRGTNSHTWSVINGKPYDPLFGTRGDEVAEAVQARFQRTNREGVWRQIGEGAVYLIKKEDLKNPDSVHGLSSGYVITEHPRRHGVNPAGIEFDAEDVRLSAADLAARIPAAPPLLVEA